MRRRARRFPPKQARSWATHPPSHRAPPSAAAMAKMLETAGSLYTGDALDYPDKLAMVDARVKVSPAAAEPSGTAMVVRCSRAAPSLALEARALAIASQIAGRAPLTRRTFLPLQPGIHQFAPDRHCAGPGFQKSPAVSRFTPPVGIISICGNGPFRRLDVLWRRPHCRTGIP